MIERKTMNCKKVGVVQPSEDKLDVGPKSHKYTEILLQTLKEKFVFHIHHE